MHSLTARSEGNVEREWLIKLRIASSTSRRTCFQISTNASYCFATSTFPTTTQR
ncbi:hypothetical protein J4Q44_G00258360, partial [Coregonus suidteri]